MRVARLCRHIARSASGCTFERLYRRLIGLSAGFFAALAQFQIRQIVALKEPTYRIVFYFSLIGTIAGFGGHLAFEGPLTPITTDNVVPLLGVAICGMLAQLSLTRAWGGGNLLLTSSLQYSAIVFAAVIGLLFFDEPIDFLSGTGIASSLLPVLPRALKRSASSVRMPTSPESFRLTLIKPLIRANRPERLNAISICHKKTLAPGGNGCERLICLD